MNAATQALSAALFQVNSAEDPSRDELLSADAVDVIGNPLPVLDDPLETLTGDELLSLSRAARFLDLRAAAIRKRRISAAASAQIQELKARKGNPS